jgi:hypothetical protein
MPKFRVSPRACPEVRTFPVSTAARTGALGTGTWATALRRHHKFMVPNVPADRKLIWSRTGPAAQVSLGRIRPGASGVSSAVPGTTTAPPIPGTERDFQVARWSGTYGDFRLAGEEIVRNVKTNVHIPFVYPTKRFAYPTAVARISDARFCAILTRNGALLLDKVARA